MGLCEKDVTPLLTHWSYLRLSCTNSSIWYMELFSSVLFHIFKSEVKSFHYSSISSYNTATNFCTCNNSMHVMLYMWKICSNHFIKLWVRGNPDFQWIWLSKKDHQWCQLQADNTIVWFLRAPRWYIGPTAMPKAAVTPKGPERSESSHYLNHWGFIINEVQ